MAADGGVRRRALLVACDTYDDERLSALNAPSHDVDALAGVLRDPAIGGYAVDAVKNQATWQVRDKVGAFFSKADRQDALLFYFSGHGIRQHRGRIAELFLAASDTVLHLLSTRSIEARWLSEMIAQSPAGQILVLLDCCFGGMLDGGWLRGTTHDMHLQSHFTLAKDRVLITASGAMEFAFEPGADRPGLSEGMRTSYFASAMVDGLHSGDADLDRDGRVSINELFIYLQNHMAAAGAPHAPWHTGSYGTFYVADNPFVTAVPPPAPPAPVSPPPIASSPPTVTLPALEPTPAAPAAAVDEAADSVAEFLALSETQRISAIRAAGLWRDEFAAYDAGLLLRSAFEQPTDIEAYQRFLVAIRAEADAQDSQGGPHDA